MRTKELDHLKKYPAATLDAPTLRTLRDGLLRYQAKEKKILLDVLSGPNAWENFCIYTDAFHEEFQEVQKAIEEIDQALKTQGVIV